MQKLKETLELFRRICHRSGTAERVDLSGMIFRYNKHQA